MRGYALGYNESFTRRRTNVPSGGAAPVIDRVQAGSRSVQESMSVGAAWLWCLVGCLGSWYVVVWLTLELTLR